MVASTPPERDPHAHHSYTKVAHKTGDTTLFGPDDPKRGTAVRRVDNKPPGNRVAVRQGDTRL